MVNPILTGTKRGASRFLGTLHTMINLCIFWLDSWFLDNITDKKIIKHEKLTARNMSSAAKPSKRKSDETKDIPWRIISLPLSETVKKNKTGKGGS